MCGMDARSVEAVILIAVFVVVGGLGSAHFFQSQEVCSGHVCPCAGDEEKTCSFCEEWDPIFTLGVVNLVEKCEGDERIVCANGSLADRTVDYHSCETELTYMGLQ